MRKVLSGDTPTADDADFYLLGCRLVFGGDKVRRDCSEGRNAQAGPRLAEFAPIDFRIHRCLLVEHNQRTNETTPQNGALCTMRATALQPAGPHIMSTHDRHGSGVKNRIENCPKSAMSMMPSLLKSKAAM